MANGLKSSVVRRDHASAEQLADHHRRPLNERNDEVEAEGEMFGVESGFHNVAIPRKGLSKERNAPPRTDAVCC